METREAMTKRLGELKAELASAAGTPTEVYSRIVGYYRSVRNWNAGKREEYGSRAVFALPDGIAAREAKALAGNPLAESGEETEGGLSLNTVRSDVKEPVKASIGDLVADYPVMAAEFPCLAKERATEPAAQSASEPAVQRVVEPAIEEKYPGEEPESESGAWLLFSKKACPNCLPVKDYLLSTGLPGRVVDVDKDEGLEMARRHGVMKAPTVLLFGENGRIAARAMTLKDLAGHLGSTHPKTL